MAIPRVLLDMRPIRSPISGVARYCIDLAQEIVASGRYEMRGLYRGTPERNPSLKTIEALYRAMPPASSANPKLLNFILEYAPRLSSTVICGKFDLVHETFFGNAHGPGRHKKIVTIHDVIPLEYPAYFNSRGVHFTRRNFMRQCKEADRILSDSAYTKKKILELGHVDDDKIVVIPLGCPKPPANIDESILEKSGLSDKRYLLFVGNVEPRKNIQGIAKALKKLGPDYSDIHFAVAGHMNFKAASILDECTELLGERFHPLGFISEAQKWALLKAATAFVFASFYEGFGIPVIECYQAKCPILIANNSSLTEIAVDERQLFDAASVESLAERLAVLLANPPWVAQSVAKGADALAKYNYATVARQTMSAYQDVLGE